MSNTIAKLVYDFANRQFHKAPINTERDLMCVGSDFANEFLAQPLISRLTDEEKERVRKMYADIHFRAAYYKSKMSKTDSLVCITHHCNSMEFYVAQIKLLESIFGKELFGEGEGC